jgi:hypothetical protein
MRIVVLLAIGLSYCIATSAFAQIRLLPPEEFDRPYNGEVVIKEGTDQNHLRELCKGVTFLGPALACASVPFGLNVCYIVKAPDAEIRSFGYDPEIVMRHEIGHCNGWPPTQPGMR